ncbi:MAG: hypothetical protein V1842_00005, partial [Candidatus Omnitrophota bacterium]
GILLQFAVEGTRLVSDAIVVIAVRIVAEELLVFIPPPVLDKGKIRATIIEVFCSRDILR